MELPLYPGKLCPAHALPPKARGRGLRYLRAAREFSPGNHQALLCPCLTVLSGIIRLHDVRTTLRDDEQHAIGYQGGNRPADRRT